MSDNNPAFIDRVWLFGKLKNRNRSVEIREPEDFHEIDESILYAKNLCREMYVSVAYDVDWKELSSYRQESDEFRRLSALYVDVPNGVREHEERIIQLFDEWFEDKTAALN